jgi:hypothetical protein
MRQYLSADFWTGNKARGALVGSVVGAGVLACLIRRARQKKQPPPTTLIEKVSEVARDVVGGDPLETGRELLAQQMLPAVKPVLLALLTDLEQLVEDALKRAEQAIKKL